MNLQNMYSTSFIFRTINLLTLKRLNTFWSIRAIRNIIVVTIFEIREEDLDSTVRNTLLDSADDVHADC